MKEKIIAAVSDFLGKMTEDKKPLLVILGPTASGKTALSLELAERFGGEIISADSRQIYKKMDIATDKILPAAQKNIPHFLLDVVEPDERFSVADFKKQATAAIADIHARGKLPLLVGGTGFYIDAVVDDFEFPPYDAALREKITQELANAPLGTGAEELHKKLQELDPQAAATIHPNNSRYVIRALEIALVTGKPRGPYKKPPPYHTLKIGLRLPQEKLFERINFRVDAQIKRGQATASAQLQRSVAVRRTRPALSECGLVDETQKLLDAGFAPNLASMSSLGYKEIVAYIQKEISLEEATELIKKNTRNYAKRQMTWFKRDRDIVWFDR